MVKFLLLILFLNTFGTNHVVADDQQPLEFSATFEHDDTVTSVFMQSVILPCKAVLLVMEPEQVMWYKITDMGLSSISVGKHLITKDPRISVAHYSFDHGLSPAKWDLYITDVRLSDAARYQCHVIQKNGHVSARSNVKLVVEDIMVNIHPSNVLVSLGDRTQFFCNFTGQHRVRREKITWLKDGKPLEADATRTTSSVEFPNGTVTILQITASRPSDSGSYRCSDGQSVQSKEAKLSLRDGNLHVFLRSLSASTSWSIFSSNRTVFYFYACLFLIVVRY